jgi:hypothetical protein
MAGAAQTVDHAGIGRWAVAARGAAQLFNRSMSKPEPDPPVCPRCLTDMRHVRVIAHLDELPEIHIFYCARCEHVETIKLKRSPMLDREAATPNS